MVDSNNNIQPIYSETTQTCEPAPYFSPAVLAVVLASEENESVSTSTADFSSEDQFIQPENQIL
ncbi:MAG TPA: hypothetical protein DDW49_06875 [Deltaproteobacteria bacterium]|nr:hypothetical protein [Deltaproteobacteria bacterium]